MDLLLAKNSEGISLTVSNCCRAVNGGESSRATESLSKTVVVAEAMDVGPVASKPAMAGTNKLRCFMKDRREPHNVEASGRQGWISALELLSIMSALAMNA